MEFEPVEKIDVGVSKSVVIAFLFEFYQELLSCLSCHQLFEQVLSDTFQLL